MGIAYKYHFSDEEKGEAENIGFFGPAAGIVADLDEVIRMTTSSRLIASDTQTSRVVKTGSPNVELDHSNFGPAGNSAGIRL